MKNDFFISLFEILQKKQPVLLATIVSQHGSSPRGTGARMAITTNKGQIGTIGGGRLEGILHDRFDELIKAQTSVILDFQLSEAEAANLDMICGGSISILVDPIHPENHELVSVYEKISQIILSQRQAWILSLLPDRQFIEKPHKCIFTVDQEISGTWVPSLSFHNNFPQKVSYQKNEFFLSNLDSIVPQIISSERYRIFLEPIGKHSTVFIVGAGHIAQKLAPLTTMVGFRTVVMDDRDDYISHDRFPTVEKTISLDDFNNVFQDVNIDRTSFIVIVTRGHQFDKSVLHQALNSNAGYIGMIGSRRKIKLTFEALVKEGVSEADLQNIHSPIGLNIGAETPEEIAISIVAELIQIRSQTNS